MTSKCTSTSVPLSYSWPQFLPNCGLYSILFECTHIRRFDKAVVSFSDCVWQLVCHMKALDPSVEFPFHIHRERIEMVQMATSRAPAASAAAHSTESSASAPADASYSLKCVLVIPRINYIRILQYWYLVTLIRTYN